MMGYSGGRQRLVVGLFAFVVALGATILTGGGGPAPASPQNPTANAAATGGPSAAPSASQPSKPKGLPIGIAYGDQLTWESDANLALGLDDAVNTGSKWVRVDLSWANIQPENSKRYEWQRFDRVFKAARDRKLEVIATIGYTPPWARKPGCTNDVSCVPANPETFAAFARKAVERYAPQGLHTWEIWNEPNIPFWYPKPDPAAYTDLLRATTKAMRAADSQAFLVMGGLAAVGTNPDKNFVSHSDYLTEVCKLGANKLVDAIGYHPYTYPHLPSAKTDFGTAFEAISSSKGNLVAVLETYGTPDLPIWLTETGAATNGPGAAADGTTIPPNATHVTEAYQAAIALDTVPAAAANKHVGAVFWFSGKDEGTEKDRQFRSKFYGLRYHDGSPKAALNSWKAAISAYEAQHPQG
ncbi:cellulase family glycosylhydrolase [Kitasatospora sp. NPDC096147]|uniref:cellulase family glycosylhydrolase n=1 Tax=Kitasatospora sp. NPDC096147 TaxID=3364093 RepID=UPI003813543B